MDCSAFRPLDISSYVCSSLQKSKDRARLDELTLQIKNAQRERDALDGQVKELQRSHSGKVEQLSAKEEELAKELDESRSVRIFFLRALCGVPPRGSSDSSGTFCLQ